MEDAFGITELDQETSFDVSIGITSQINDNLSLTIDAYQIDIDDRVVISGGIIAADFPEFRVERTYQDFMHAPPLPVRWLPLAELLGWHLWVHLRPGARPG